MWLRRIEALKEEHDNEAKALNLTQKEVEVSRGEVKRLETKTEKNVAQLEAIELQRATVRKIEAEAKSKGEELLAHYNKETEKLRLEEDVRKERVNQLREIELSTSRCLQQGFVPPRYMRHSS